MRAPEIVQAKLETELGGNGSEPVCDISRLRSPRTGLLRNGAWRWRRNESSLHGSHRRRARLARHRQLALPVSLHGAWLKAARSATTGGSNDPRRYVYSTGSGSRMSTHWRREIVWRQDGVAGSGKSSVARSLRTGVPWISPASGRSSIAGSRQTLIRRANPDAVLARHPR